MKHTDLEGLESLKFDTYLDLPQVDIHTPDNLFIKTFAIPKGALVPQHSHQYSHVTLVCKGKVIAWKDRDRMGEYVEGQYIQIEAGAFHEFMAMEDSRLACIHNVEQYDKLVEMNGFDPPEM